MWYLFSEKQTTFPQFYLYEEAYVSWEIISNAK